jgi:hypothetical protein
LQTTPIEVTNPELGCQIQKTKNIVADEAETFSITVSLVDKFTKQLLPNISWQVSEKRKRTLIFYFFKTKLKINTKRTILGRRVFHL